jgi:SAM-dependent methyltransferase
MPSDDNAAQKAFWTEATGPKWVAHQADLDLVMDSVAALVIGAAEARAGERVLDIGCGTGATSLAFARIVGAEGRVTGADVSETMLARARDRQREAGLTNIDFVLADAQDHAFAPGASDLIVSRFGMMFFADPLAAFRNMGRALKPGGRMHFAAWAGPEHNPFFTLPQAVAVARLGPVEPVPPEAPGPMAFRDIARVTGMLREAGLAGVEGRMVQTDLHHPGTAEKVASVLVMVGSAGRVIIEKGGTAEDAAAVRDDLSAALRRFETADGVRIPAGINMFSAVRG